MKRKVLVIVLCTLAGLIATVGLVIHLIPCEHSYQSAITVSATCTQEGEETFTCVHCQESYTQPIAMTEHTYEPGEIVKDPTCAEEGTQKYLCTACDAEKTEPVEKLPHTPGETSVTKEPNCTEEGEITALCTVCGGSEVVEKIPTNEVHVFENTVVREATCIDPGEGVNTCSLCQHSERCEYELKPHNYDVGEVTKKATCTKNGKKKLTCSVCTEVTEETIEAKGHNWEGATCTKAGVCSVCGATGSKASHDYVVIQEYITTSLQDATCRVRECKTCGTQKTLYYAKDGRQFDMDSFRTSMGNCLKKLGFNVVYVTYESKGWDDDWNFSQINDSYMTQSEFLKTCVIPRIEDFEIYYSQQEGGISSYTAYVWARVYRDHFNADSRIEYGANIVKTGT